MTRRHESTTHVMLDLETMGNGPDAAIVAIGAVAFCVADMRILDTHYTAIDLESSVREGGIMNASTVLWWMRQSDEARAEFENKCHADIDDALRHFSRWMNTLGDTDAIPVWGNGAGFDNVILRRAYERAHHDTPWSHWNDRCYRTMVKLHDPKRLLLKRTGTHHNALDDATTQATHAIAMLQQLQAVPDQDAA